MANQRLLGLAILLGLSGCTSDDVAAQRFAVHEWGTFTAVSGSDGTLQMGMHHSEETLPPFVHSYRDTGETNDPVVNEKLETPVLYFYTERPLDVSVHVRFPQGIVSEWYPQASSRSGVIDDAGLTAHGSASWELQVRPGAANGIPVAPDSQWAPSRAVPDAAAVSAGGEEEGFVFYRGLGRFETPLRIRIEGDQLHLVNDARDTLSAAFLLHVHDGGARIVPLGAIEEGVHDMLLEPSPKEHDIDVYVDDAKLLVQRTLVAEGLTVDEAVAMVETWSSSYFETPGMRVLYVLPRAWSDALLPLEVSPQPTEIVRVMVGRVEIMQPEEERAIVQRLETAATTGVTMRVDDLGRLAEPKLRRAVALTTMPAARTLGEALIGQLSAL